MVHHQVGPHGIARDMGSDVLDLIPKIRVAREQTADVFEVTLYCGCVLDGICGFAFEFGFEDRPWVAVQIKHASVQCIVDVADDLLKVGCKPFERDSGGVALE